jgi:transcription initiation factor TFIID TATA-box-binding protein
MKDDILNFNKKEVSDDIEKESDISIDFISVDDLNIEIQNCVYTCYLFDPTKTGEKITLTSVRKRKQEDFGVRLHLLSIAREFKSQGAQYNKKRFAAVIVRNKEPTKEALLIFSQAKIVCTGAKSKHQALFYINWIIGELKIRLDYPTIQISELKVENIVCSTRINREIDINALANEYSDLGTHDSIFPGNIFRHPSIHPITILIFDSGKLVITGSKDLTSAKRALTICLRFITKFTKKRDNDEQTFTQTVKVNRINSKIGEINRQIRKERLFEENMKEEKKRSEIEAQKKKEEEEIRLEEESRKLEKSMADTETDYSFAPSILLKAGKLGLSREDWKKVLSKEIKLE